MLTTFSLLVRKRYRWSSRYCCYNNPQKTIPPFFWPINLFQIFTIECTISVRRFSLIRRLCRRYVDPFPFFELLNPDLIFFSFPPHQQLFFSLSRPIQCQYIYSSDFICMCCILYWLLSEEGSSNTPFFENHNFKIL